MNFSFYIGDTYIYIENIAFEIHTLVCSIVFCVGLAFLFWTLFVSKGKKLTKCLISGGIALATHIWTWVAQQTFGS